MANVNLTIDGKSLSVPAGTSILAAARANGIHIPTLCFLEKLDPRASCRMCVVEVEGARTFQHACAAKVREGMAVHTDTEAIRASRKLTLQLLLSNHNVDCHHCLRIGSSRCADLDPWFCETCFFCDCVKDGFCELQALAREYGIDRLPFPQRNGTCKIDDSSVIVRDPNKCIKCRRCVDVCNQVQTVHNLAASGRGCELTIGPTFGKPMAESICIGCGRCVEVCPTGALFAREHKDEVIYQAHRADVTSVAMADAALIPELERIWPHKKEAVTLRQIIGSLRKIGFEKVYSADDLRALSRVETEHRLNERLKKGLAIVFDSRAAEKLLTRDYASLSDCFVSVPSALSVFAGLEQKAGDVKTCAFTALGPEASEADETGCVDYVVNARELYRIMVRTGAEPNPGRLSEPDKVDCGKASGVYGRVLELQSWSLDREPERFELQADGRSLSCVICRNPAQFRAVLREDRQPDIIRVIV